MNQPTQKPPITRRWKIISSKFDLAEVQPKPDVIWQRPGTEDLEPFVWM